MFSFLIADNLFEHTDVFQDLKAHALDMGLTEKRLILTVLSLFLFMIFTTLLKVIFNRYKKVYRPFIVGLLLYLPILTASFLLPAMTEVFSIAGQNVFILTFILFTKMIWAVFHFTSPQVTFKNFFSNLIQPHFVLFPDRHPLKRLHIQNSKNLLDDLKDLTPLLLEYSLYLLAYLILKSVYCWLYLDQEIYGFIFDPKLFFEASYLINRQAEVSFVDFVFKYLLFGLIFYLGLFFIFGELVVIAARLSGFQIARNTNQPWLAKSFKDFFFRSSYYYGHILVQYFYLPMRAFFYPLLKHRRSWLTSVSLMFSLVLGGLMIHTFRAVSTLFSQPQFIKNMHIKSFQYLLVFALACLLIRLDFIKSDLLRFLMFIATYSAIRYFYDFPLAVL